MENKNLKFKPHLVEKILTGQKNITWRLFDDKNLQVGDNLNYLNSETGEVFAQAVIITCEEKAIKDLTTEDLKANEYIDQAQVLELNRKYYGDEVGENTMVKIVEFRTL